MNIFKRDKPVENTNQPSDSGTEPQMDSQVHADARAPLDPAETPATETPAPAVTAPTTPPEAGGAPSAEKSAEPAPSLPQGKAEEKSAPPISPSPESPRPPDRAKVPDISSALKPPPPRKRSLVYHLFSPETRLGRFMRPVLRWLGAITGLFALGLLSGYVLIYQPTQRELDAALKKLSTTNQLVSQKDQGLASAQSGLDQAQLTVKQVQDKLDAAASENQVLLVLVDVSNARVALVQKDGAAAKTAIQQAQTNLTQALPYLQSQDKVLSDLLVSRLDLISKELVSDPQAAQSELGKLSSDLSNLRQKLFGQ